MQFEMKETVLKKAWQKKMQVGGKPVFFDHDYRAEIVQKRKTYVGIKKVLKEKGIRFQTPLTKIRIHWNKGVRTYGSAREAAHCGHARRGHGACGGREDATRAGVAASDGAKSEPGHSAPSWTKTTRLPMEILKRL